MKRIIKLLMLLLFCGCLSGCGGPKEIEINSYVDVEFEGYDTLGSITEYEFDAKQLLEDYEKELENVSRKDLERLLQEAIEFDASTELKNGDEITVSWDIDEDDLQQFEEENKVKLVYSDFTIVVDDLEELEAFDPFEKISVSFEGHAPYVNAYIDNARSSGDVGYIDFYYVLDQRRNLSNGDVVTVTVSCQEEDFARYCIETYGMIPETQTKEFAVSGCSEFVADVTKIASADMTKINEHIQETLKGKTESWVFPESYCGMTFMGNVFARALENDASSIADENVLYFVYKVDVDSIRDGLLSYYYYGSIDNLVFDADGTLVYDLNKIEVPTSTTSGRYTKGTYFEYCDLNYDGYQTYDEFYAAKIQPLLEKYSVVDSVDKDIITKQTHEPRDYTKITAEVKLGADCFTYKWYQGSYHVAGLTEKGYQELTKYSAADYVSLQLPAATEDGSVVEGMYSSGEEGGYSFSSLAAANVPCIELVCPETYLSFYGFCEDNKFNSTYAFKLRSIVLNEELVEIAASAFKNCVGLESMVLPAKVEKIPEQAFYGCSNLEKVTFTDSVTAIEEEAFANCPLLTVDSVNVSSMKVGKNAFSGVTINTVILGGDEYVPERSKSWGTLYSSWNQATIKKLVIEDGVTKIPDYAFEGASGITEITIPSSVTTIGTRAFAGNGDLASLVLSEGLETIGEEAFEGSAALKEAVIPSTLVSIGKKAFANCQMLVVDSMEVGAMKIADDAFFGVTFNEVTLTSDSYVPERRASYGTVYAPWNGAIVKKLVIGDAVTKIPDYAFELVGGFTEVVIPASITQIGTRAFAGNTDLRTITLPEGLEVIGEEAFNGCTDLALESLEIGALTIGSKAFYGVTIKDLVLSGDGYVSNRYTSWGTVYTPWDGAIIKKITINEGVTAIPDYAFEYCEGITEVVLPTTVKTIGVGAFYHSSTFKTIVLNEGLETIGEAAFKECTNLKTVNIPSTVNRIDKEAFHSCSSLLIDTLNIGGMTIGTYAFHQAAIGDVVLDSNEFTSLRYTSWGRLYSPWTGATVKNITITENVTELPDYVFEDIVSIKEVVIPASVTKIGKSAFTKSEELTILAPAGSAAETYAADHGIAFAPHN